MTNRELDMLVAEKVMGLCAGESYYISPEEYAYQVRPEILHEWETKYGVIPPQAFIDEEAMTRAYCATEGDYGPRKCGKCGGQPHPEIKHYSSSIAAAWEVVQALRNSGHTVIIHAWHHGPFCKVEICRPSEEFVSTGENVAEHICLAALKSVGVEVETEADERRKERGCY